MRITTPEESLLQTGLCTRPSLSSFQACAKPPQGPFPTKAVIFLRLVLSQITETMGNILCLLKSVWISVSLLMESELKGKPLLLTKGNNIRCLGDGLTTFNQTMGDTYQKKDRTHHTETHGNTRWGKGNSSKHYTREIISAGSVHALKRPKTWLRKWRKGLLCLLACLLSTP